MESNNKKVIAAFDFDGTITTKDTLFDFIQFYCGSIKFFTGIIIISPILILYKIGFIKNYKAKQILVSYFFKNKTVDSFEEKCNSYKQRINKICRADTLKKIEWHRQQGHSIIIISASIRNWIEPWALEYGAEKVIGTEIETKENLITGYFSSKNCYGEEKVNRLKKIYPNRNDYILYAYGDSRGDKELLEFADHPHLLTKE